MKVQATKMKRTSITDQSQWLWCDFVTSMFNDLWRKNGGLFKNTGKTFRELMQNFLLGLVEACITTDAGGNIRIIGAADRKNHKKIIADR